MALIANFSYVMDLGSILLYLMPLNNGTVHLKNVNNYLNINIYSYLATCVSQSSILYINVVHFLNTSVN